jgi:hypothetical protein
MLKNHEKNTARGRRTMKQIKLLSLADVNVIKVRTGRAGSRQQMSDVVPPLPSYRNSHKLENWG